MTRCECMRVLGYMLVGRRNRVRSNKIAVIERKTRDRKILGRFIGGVKNKAFVKRLNDI